MQNNAQIELLLMFYYNIPNRMHYKTTHHYMQLTEYNFCMYATAATEVTGNDMPAWRQRGKDSQWDAKYQQLKYVTCLHCVMHCHLQL